MMKKAKWVCYRRREWEELCKSNFRSPTQTGIMSAEVKWIQKGLFINQKFFIVSTRAGASLKALALRSLHHVG